MKLELSEEHLAEPTFLLHHRLDRAVRIRMDFQVSRQVANRLSDIASAQFSFSEFFEYAPACHQMRRRIHIQVTFEQLGDSGPGARDCCRATHLGLLASDGGSWLGEPGASQSELLLVS